MRLYCIILFIKEQTDLHGIQAVQFLYLIRNEKQFFLLILGLILYPMVCEILFSNLYLNLIEFEINYNYNYNYKFITLPQTIGNINKECCWPRKV
jgi:hypothetical protein